MARKARNARTPKARPPPPSRPPSPAFERLPIENLMRDKDPQARFPPAAHNYDPRLMQEDEIVRVIQAIGEILDEEICEIQRTLEEIREDALEQYTSSESLANSTPGTPEFKPMPAFGLPDLHKASDAHDLPTPLSEEGSTSDVPADIASTPRRSQRLAESATRLTESNLQKFNEANKTRR